MTTCTYNCKSTGSFLPEFPHRYNSIYKQNISHKKNRLNICKYMVMRRKDGLTKVIDYITQKQGFMYHDDGNLDI